MSQAGSLAGSLAPSRTDSPALVDEGPCEDGWFFDAATLENGPSTEDGIPVNEQNNKHFKAFMFLTEMSKQLNIKDRVLAVAMTYYHRMYVYQSLSDFPWLPMSYCCLFVALKAEEQIMKMESLLKWAQFTRQKMQGQQPKRLDKDSREFFEMKEQLAFFECILLKTLGFDMLIQTTVAVIPNLCVVLRSEGLLTAGAKELAKRCWEWGLASFGYNFCVRYEPQRMACAFIYGASHDLGLEISNHSSGTSWWQHITTKAGKPLDASEEDLKRIMTEFHDYCQARKMPRREGAPPPNDPRLYGQPNDLSNGTAAAGAAAGTATTGAGTDPAVSGTEAGKQVDPQHQQQSQSQADSQTVAGSQSQPDSSQQQQSDSSQQQRPQSPPQPPTPHLQNKPTLETSSSGEGAADATAAAAPPEQAQAGQKHSLEQDDVQTADASKRARTLTTPQPDPAQ